MTVTIDYYFGPQSPWAYMGHERLAHIAAAAGVGVRVLPADLGRVFAVSGGLPLAQRPLQRQAYRLVELARFAHWLKLPLNPQPAYFPVAGDPSARLIIAVNQADGAAAAMQLTGRVMAAVWAQQRDIANPATLADLLAESNLPAARLDQAQAAEVQAIYARNTDEAIAANVFGSPSYVISGEIFWGQDRLDFVERRLQQQAGRG